MKYAVCMFMMLITGHQTAYGCFGCFKSGSREAVSEWVLPDGDLEYSKLCSLTAHNAFSNNEDGRYIYDQQSMSIEEQLRYGVRGFMLDFWKDKDSGNIVLSHGDPEGTITGSSLIHTLDARNLMILLVSWLRRNPQEVLTLFLENYVKGDKTNEMLHSVDGFSDLVLCPDTWNLEQNNYRWPTLSRMISDNRRLVIFDGKALSSYGYRVRRYITENMYGSYKLAQAARVRHGSREKLALFLMNYFDNVKSWVGNGAFTAEYNEPKQLKKLIEWCRENGTIKPEQQPNFIALNFIGRGNPLKLVNEINRRAAQQ